jgi:hypothetical protein
VYVLSTQFVTHFILRSVQSKLACQRPQGHTSKRGRRPEFVLLPSGFKLPLAEVFYFALFHTILDKLRQRVYLCHRHVEYCCVVGGASGAEDEDDLYPVLQQPMVKAEYLLAGYT